MRGLGGGLKPPAFYLRKAVGASLVRINFLYRFLYGPSFIAMQLGGTPVPPVSFFVYDARQLKADSRGPTNRISAPCIYYWKISGLLACGSEPKA